MTIDFYYMPESPPCRAVEMVARLVGVNLNKQYINLFTREHLKEDFIKINPSHKLPFIVDGDLKLGESRAIMAYLVNKYKPEDEFLYPKDPEIRAKIDELLYFDIGTLYQSASKLLRPMLFGPVKEFDPADEKALQDALHYLDKRLGDNHARRFVMSNHLSIADVSLAATFTFIVACGYNIHDYKQIVVYLERMKAAIPDYSEINDEACENLRKFVESKQEGK